MKSAWKLQERPRLCQERVCSLRMHIIIKPHRSSPAERSVSQGHCNFAPPGLLQICVIETHLYLLNLDLCRMCYNMCTQKPPHDYSEQLYNRYRDAFTRYIVEKVPPLHESLHHVRPYLLCCLYLRPNEACWTNVQPCVTRQKISILS